jgi:hypothetical protein
MLTIQSEAIITSACNQFFRCKNQDNIIKIILQAAVAVLNTSSVTDEEIKVIVKIIGKVLSGI